MDYLVIELNKQEQFLTLILEHEKEIEELSHENIGARTPKKFMDITLPQIFFLMEKLMDSDFERDSFKRFPGVNFQGF